ncbi:hypothetical protein GCM10011408_14650 [Dyella caseinilytica]|nr:hypothetical protein GCM10011408_14650 [Dyella caseinilytica]
MLAARIRLMAAMTAQARSKVMGATVSKVRGGVGGRSGRLCASADIFGEGSDGLMAVMTPPSLRLDRTPKSVQHEK